MVFSGMELKLDVEFDLDLSYIKFSIPYHDRRFVGRALCTIGERAGDAEVAIKTDDEQVKHRGIAGEVVER